MIIKLWPKIAAARAKFLEEGERKYAVLGAWMVGHTLATKLVAPGHYVQMGAQTSDNEKAAAWAKANRTRYGHGSFADVATWAERVIFAVNGANIVAWRRC